MTSNIGSHIIQDKLSKITEDNKDHLINQTSEEVFELLKKTIRPEFLNRVDEIIMFKPLSQDEIKDIVMLQFENVKKMLAKNGVSIEITDKAVEQISEMGFDPQFGARPVKRVLQRNVLNELSKMIISGSVNKNDTILVDVKDGNIIFVNK